MNRIYFTVELSKQINEIIIKKRRRRERERERDGKATKTTTTSSTLFFIKLITK